MLRKLKPNPALAVAVCALFVALAGSAVAAGVVPLAKRALSADNAKLLQGKTAVQIAAIVPPVSSVGALTSVKSASFSLAADQESNFTVSCDVGTKALGASFDNPSTALVIDAGERWAADGAGVTFDLINLSSSIAATGTVFVTCIK